MSGRRSRWPMSLPGGSGQRHRPPRAGSARPFRGRRAGPRSPTCSSVPRPQAAGWPAGGPGRSPARKARWRRHPGHARTGLPPAWPAPGLATGRSPSPVPDPRPGGWPTRPRPGRRCGDDRPRADRRCPTPRTWARGGWGPSARSPRPPPAIAPRPPGDPGGAPPGPGSGTFGRLRRLCGVAGGRAMTPRFRLARHRGHRSSARRSARGRQSRRRPGWHG
jgi:hypothetical protein